MPSSHRGDIYASSGDQGGSSFATVERAADAIRASAGDPQAMGALRDIRVALLVLPKDPSSVPEVQQADMVAVLKVLKVEVENVDIILTGLVLMRYLAQRQENQKRMSSSNAVSLVLQALHLHDSHPTLQGVACDALGNLLQDQANADQFLAQRGVDAVFSVVNANMSNSRVMEAACFLLGNVASTEEGLKHIALNGGGAVALTVMKAHEQDAELLRELLFLLSNMAQSPPIRRELAHAGAVAAVTAVMQNHAPVSELQAMGCSALDNLFVVSSSPSEPPAPPVPDTALNVVLESLKAHGKDGAVVRRAAGAIASMAQHVPPNRNLIRADAALKLLLRAAQGVVSSRSDQQVLVQVFRALEALAGIKENHALLLAPGALLSLALAVVDSQSPRPAPVGKGLAVVAKVCESEEALTGRPCVAPAEALALVTKSLAHYWNHPSVVLPSCTIVAALAKSTPAPAPAPAPADDDAWRQAVQGLVKAVKARPGDVAVAVSACVAVAWACERRVRPDEGLVADAMSAFVMVMRAHPRDPDVAEAACFMFAAVAKAGGPQVRGQVIKSGAPLLVVLVLRHFGDDPGDVQPVLRRAVNAIRLVGLDDSATAGAVRLAGAPDALRNIIQRFPENQTLKKAAEAALEAIEKDVSSGA